MSVKGTSPELVTIYDAFKAYNGYTLFAPVGAGNVWLVDMQGRFVHRWEMQHRPGDYGVLLTNGNLLYAGKVIPGPLTDIGGFGGVLLEADWDGTIVWKYEDPYMHHDFCRMDNGNTMVLRWVSIPDDIAARIKGGVPGTEREGVIWADSFQEITPAGEVVWEWLGYEHLDPGVDVICPLCSRNQWIHANACFVLPNGDILTTFRRTDTVAIIEKGTGDIKWRWGVGELAHPHDPTLLENGNILIFDNGCHRALHPGNYSRVVEVNPDTGKIEWEYKADPPVHFYGSFISGCQRLPNGNTLICEGPTGRIFEVTGDGELVWEFISPFYYEFGEFGTTNQFFRAYRFGPDYEGLKGKTLDPDRFEWVLKEKGKPGVAQIYPPPDEEKAVRDRLTKLGY
jgi:outer membrane protein assembly factor BamB